MRDQAMKIEGLRELEKALMELKTTTAKGVARRAMKKSLAPFRDRAAAMAPRGTEPLEGRDERLADSLAITTRLSRSQRRGLKLDRDTVYMFAGPSGQRHAHLVEFGTGPRFQKNGRYVGRMPAQPFMRPAWDATKAEVLKRISEEMRREIEKTVARIAKREAKAAAQ